MAKKRKSDYDFSAAEASSWRSRIAQSTNRRATTRTARWRRWKQVFKVGGMLLVACVVLGGAVLLLEFLKSNKADDILGSASQPLRRVYFSSNGVLDQAWIERAIDVPPNTALMAIDIQRLQERLSEVGQIRSVIVERIFPDALLIKVSEHDPLLRMVMQEPDGRRTVRLVSRQGHVYRGQNYPSGLLRQLPYVAGITLRADERGSYLPVNGIATVTEFLDLARVLTPALYANWSFVDLSAYGDGPRAVGSEIHVNTKSGAQIIFSPANFPLQLERLHEIVTRRLDEEQRQRVELIDLSLPDPVVRLANRRGTRTGI